YLAVRGLQRAAANGDMASIAERVDFTTLRESLRADLTRKAQASARAAPGDPLTQLGAGLALAFGPSMVDAMVTPEMVALLLEGVVPGSKDVGPAPGGPADLDLSMGYSTLNRFIVDAKQRGTSEPPVQLVFTRSGLATWTLTSARLP